MSAKKTEDYKFLVSVILVLVVLLLSIFNLNQIASKNKVLGAKNITIVDTAEVNKEIDFWKEFLSKNPSYFQGWVELSNLNQLIGQNDEASNDLTQARKIEPNREIQQ